MAEEGRQPDLAAWSTFDLLRGAFRLYRRNGVTFICVLGVAFVATALVQVAAALPGLTEASRVFLSTVAMVVAGTGSLALARAILRRLHGQAASVGDAYGFILERLSGYAGLLLLTVGIALGVGIVAALTSGLLAAVGLGALGLPLVGGLALAVVLALALVPFGFAENLSVMDAVARSRTLAQAEWPALLLNLVLYALPFGVSFWLTPPTTVGTILDVAISVVYTPFPLAFLGLIYLRALGPASDPASGEGEPA